jgi:hypothetical protein
MTQPSQEAMMRSESPLIARIVLAIVGAMALSIPIGITIISAGELSLLERTGQITTGKIASKQCSNHGNVTYSYVVDGKPYSGQSCRIPVCRDAAIGTDLPVIYAADRPSLSRCDSLAATRSNISGNIFAIIFTAVLGSVAIYRVTLPKKEGD